MDEVQFRLSNGASIPTLRSDNLYDLISSQDITLYPNNTCTVDTGIAAYLPNNLRLLTNNTTIQSANNIDIIMTINSFNSNILIMLRNSGLNTYKIKKGITKIAQFFIVSDQTSSITLKEYNDNKN